MIYFIRHAKTLDNLKGLIQTNINTDIQKITLSDKIIFFKKLDNFNLKKLSCIYTSTLKRTIETANVLFPDSKKISKNLFNEVDCHEIDNIPKNLYTRKELNSKVSISKYDVIDQIEEIISFLRIIQNSMDNVLVFSHGMLIRAIISYLNNIDFDIYDLINSKTVKFYNLSIAQIDIDKLKVNKIIL